MSEPVLPLTEQLRQAILTSGKTRYAISKATGVGQDTLSRFVHDERGLSMEAMDAIGQFLGLELKMKRPVRTQKKGG